MGSNTSSPSPEPSEPHTPTSQDVYQVRSHLLNFLPPEVIEIILEHASYYPWLTFTRTSKLAVHASQTNDNNADWVYMITPALDFGPVSVGLGKVREVRFMTKSCDQGFGGSGFQGRYFGSYTWFETSILRPLDFQSLQPYTTPWWKNTARNFPKDVIPGSSDLVPRYIDYYYEMVSKADSNDTRWLLQKNVCAERGAKEHVVSWTLEPEKDGSYGDDDMDEESGAGSGHGFVEKLRMGDKIVVYARAQFPQWVNNVEEVTVEVQYTC